MSEESTRVTVLDTHVWIWMVEGDHEALSASAIEAIEEAGRGGAVRVSAISVWEVAMLESDDWVRTALRAEGVRLLPLTPEIAIESARLPGGPGGDPADRILMANARIAGGCLATCDQAIIEYAKSGQLGVFDGRG